jgi:type II secretory pathway component GspD/PulD (secretin)
MRTRGNALAALAAIMLAGIPAFAQGDGPLDGGLTAPRTGGAQRIHIDVDNVDLADVMDLIGRQVGRNILVDPTVQESVTVSLRDIPWREAVDVIARMTRCEVEERPGGILVLTQPPKVTIQFTDANVRTVLQLLAAYSGKNIIISPKVAGTVTLDLKEVHWLRALHAIVKTVGDYEVVEETEDLLRVVSRDSIEQQLETVVYTLKYVRPPANYRAVPPRPTGRSGGGTAATVFVGPPTGTIPRTELDPQQSFTLYRALRSVITQSQIRGAVIDYDQGTNAFVVTATRPLLNQLKAIIDKLDIAPHQIFAEVKFVSTRNNNNQEHGIEFTDGSRDQGLRFTGPFGDLRTVTAADPAFIDPNTIFAGTPRFVDRNVGEYPFLFGGGLDSFTKPFVLPGILDLRGLQFQLNMIDRDDRARIVQSPSLFMLDNQSAVIFVGENVPYATLRAQPDANGNVVQTLEEGADSPVAIGFSLFLQSHVIPDTDRIAMTVIPRVNDLVGSSDPTLPGFERFAFGPNLQLSLPRTREQALVTHIMLDDGYTAVVGGLLAETDIEVVKRVPILSNLPIIGNLFTNKNLSRRIENLTIFITPTIVRDRATSENIFSRATRRLEETDWFYRTREMPEDEDGDSTFADDDD